MHSFLHKKSQKNFFRIKHSCNSYSSFKYTKHCNKLCKEGMVVLLYLILGYSESLFHLHICHGWIRRLMNKEKRKKVVENFTKGDGIWVSDWKFFIKNWWVTVEIVWTSIKDTLIFFYNFPSRTNGGENPLDSEKIIMWCFNPNM